MPPASHLSLPFSSSTLIHIATHFLSVLAIPFSSISLFNINTHPNTPTHYLSVLAMANTTTTATTPLLNNHHRNKHFNFNFSFVDFKPLSLHSGKPLLSLSFSPQPTPPSLQRTRVSTATVEYVSPAPDFDFHQEISRLKSLNSNLSESTSLEEKHSVLDNDSRVKRYFSKNSVVFDKLDYKELYLVKCLVAAGQEHVVEVVVEEEEDDFTARSAVKSALYAVVEMIEKFDLNDKSNGSKSLQEEEVEELKKLLKILGEIDRFYDCIGGVIGYQLVVLELLAQSTHEKQNPNRSQHLKESMDCQFLEIHPPDGLDLSKNKEYASQAALWGIQGLPELGEIYPLGGSADRLGLVDPDTGECLPAAMLPFCGRTLLEGLIRDLQIYGKQCITPVAIMTSSAKNNHARITSLCERMNWFGRGQSSFQLFEQPLVPAVSAVKGEWIVAKPFGPICKPGGHGVIWKLAYDKGIFDWFYDHGRKGATVRQVSNVVAATDVTLLALAGIGLHQGKKLGFASCKRNSGATEGINVLLEKKKIDGKWSYGLSCIEYTEFDKFGITSGSENSLQAEFPANTNILYVDLPSVELVASSKSEKSLPGMVLNTKKPIAFVDNYGNCHSVLGGRLECTMQNIADNFSNTYVSRCYQDLEDNLDTFIVYDERRRVTSSAKKRRRRTEDSLHQTPDGALLDTLRNAYDLLTHCDVKLPEIDGNKKYVDSEPPFLVLLHPALGPLWEVTRQKFNGGSISEGSELQIEVSEFMWRNVQLDGSLIVLADNVMGSTRTDSNGESILHYGHGCARCKLQNVKVTNKGIDWSFGGNVYWKHDVRRVETLKVILHGSAEFEANDIVLQGNHLFEVPDGYKMKVASGNSGLEVKLNPIETRLMDTGSWYWNYKLDGTHIRLEYIEL